MSQACRSEDRVERLKSHWRDGCSASQIAASFGDVTRNAVIGKLHRLGLVGRSSDGQSHDRPRIQRAPRQPRTPRSAPVLLPAEIDPLLLPDGSFATMRSVDQQMCRWPVGDPTSDDFHFCGHPHKPGATYCEVHCRRAYQPNSKSDRARSRRAA
jgi:GcrA cell cycle regulator